MGQGSPSGGSGPFHGASYQYQTSIDPEELFRKIFGDFNAKFDRGDQDFAESQFGFKASKEVRMT